jgi:hypothetical protein
LIVRTNASAIPLLCGLSIGVVLGSSPMSRAKLRDAKRRVITGDNAQGQSVIIVDGGPSSEIGNPDMGGLFEIWEDAAFGALKPSADEDLGATRPVLGPRKRNFQVRWFIIHPLPEGRFVKVIKLGIELRCEPLDIFARDNFFLALKTHANSKIVEPFDHRFSPSWIATLL